MSFDNLFVSRLLICAFFFQNYSIEASPLGKHNLSLAHTSPSLAEENEDYWTAYIQIDHITIDEKTNKRKFYSELSETGVFISKNSRDVKGVAVILQSLQPNRNRRSNNTASDDNSSLDMSLSFRSESNEHRTRSNSGFQENVTRATGCVPPFLDNYPNNESWIAVVRNGQCLINDKIQNALSLNASGVLIYDDREGRPLYSMKGIFNIRIYFNTILNTI